MAQVVVKYQFDAQGEGELSVRVDEVLSLVDETVGSGWWMLQNSRGQSGLVPSDFVERMSPSHSTPLDSNYGQWDEWDDSESDDATAGRSAAQTPQHSASNLAVQRGGANRESISISNLPSMVHANDLSKVNLIRKAFKANFCKSGGEEYFIAAEKCAEAGAKVFIQFYQGNWVWGLKHTPYSCSILDFKKDAKFKGIKTYISYSLSTPLSPRPVHRRYKHFFWLHGILENKFPCILIPALPDRTITNRFEEDFVTDRRKLLQRWLDWICRHPVLSNCDVIHHFMTCGDDEKKWKAGKRDAENDRYQGGRFYLSVNSPEEWTNADVINHDHVERYIQMQDKALKPMTDNLYDHEKHLRNETAKAFGAMSACFTEMGQSLAKDVTKYPGSLSLKASFDNMASIFQKMNKEYIDTTNSKEAETLIDILHDFEGLSSTMPKLAVLTKSVSQLLEDGNKAVTEDKVSPKDNKMLLERAAVIGRSVMAEMYFHSESRYADWSKGFEAYLREKAGFYQKLSALYTNAADHFAANAPK